MKLQSLRDLFYHAQKLEKGFQSGGNLRRYLIGWGRFTPTKLLKNSNLDAIFVLWMILRPVASFKLLKSETAFLVEKKTSRGLQSEEGVPSPLSSDPTVR